MKNTSTGEPAVLYTGYTSSTMIPNFFERKKLQSGRSGKYKAFMSLLERMQLGRFGRYHIHNHWYEYILLFIWGMIIH